MASLAFPSLAKTTTTKDGTTYGYVYSPSASPTKPTLLFLHGYPSASYDWRNQIATFTSLGYGVLVPDLLGYGDTAKPTSLASYAMPTIGRQVEDLLDAEGLTSNIVAVAHDWGCGLLSSMARFHSPRYIGYVFVAVGYLAQSFENIDAINEETQKTLGYPQFGYWLFHNQPDAAPLIEANMPTFNSLCYPADPRLWITTLCPIGAVREFVAAGKPEPQAPWLTEAERETHSKILLAGGMDGPLAWYRQAMDGVTTRAEAGQGDGDRVLDVPTLFVGATRDYVCLSQQMEELTRPWAKAGLDVVNIDAGHWVYIEKRKEFDEALHGWLEKKFG